MPDTSTFYDVIILGAGAAGLMAAITASNRGRKVLILEKSNKVGKKILMSGGGRCNFTNEFVEAENFISENEHFCKSALNQFLPVDFIRLVETHGIEYEKKKNNQYFCIHSSREILDMLLNECKYNNVQIMCDINVTQILSTINTTKKFQINCDEMLKNSSNFLTFDCESLLIATGALSIPTLGGSGYGYDVATQYALEVTETKAGLVPFIFTDKYQSVFKNLAGISIYSKVECNNQIFYDNILFTHKGISGPAILQISNYWNPGDSIKLNLVTDTNLSDKLIEAKNNGEKILLKTFLRQFLPKSFLKEFENIWWGKFKKTPIEKINESELKTIANQIHNWTLNPSSTEGYRTAEVTVGGVKTSRISSKTMEVKDYPGLYFAGEVMDVTGHLGGFNFQWAWASGYCAGLNL